jgi:hypothetical protein
VNENLQTNTTEQAPAEQPKHVIPDALPTPPATLRATSEFPMETFGLVCLLASGLGVGLFVGAKIIYVYLLYNSLIGVALGWGLAKFPREKKYTDEDGLLGVTLFVSVMPYIVMNFAWFLVARAAIAEEYPGTSITIGEFFEARCEDTFLAGIEPGVMGWLIIWTIEIGITFVVAWNQVSAAILVTKIEAIPKEVTEFVLHLMSEEKTEETIRAELSTRGWSNPDDQRRAIEAANAVVASLNQQQNS